MSFVFVGCRLFLCAECATVEVLRYSWENAKPSAGHCPRRVDGDRATYSFGCDLGSELRHYHEVYWLTNGAWHFSNGPIELSAESVSSQKQNATNRVKRRMHASCVENGKGLERALYFQHAVRNNHFHAMTDVVRAVGYNNEVPLFSAERSSSGLHACNSTKLVPIDLRVVMSRWDSLESTFDRDLLAALVFPPKHRFPDLLRAWMNECVAVMTWCKTERCIETCVRIFVVRSHRTMQMIYAHL